MHSVSSGKHIALVPRIKHLFRRNLPLSLGLSLDPVFFAKAVSLAPVEKSGAGQTTYHTVPLAYNITLPLQALWQRLSGLALETQQLETAERCYAALGDAPRARFLHKVSARARVGACSAKTRGGSFAESAL